MLYLGSQFFIELLLFALSSRLLTLPRVYLLCLTWVVSSVVIYREKYLTKSYYKPRFSQWVASSKFVEFL